MATATRVTALPGSSGASGLPGSSGGRRLPGDARLETGAMVRVDQAGEYGAARSMPGNWR